MTDKRHILTLESVPAWRDGHALTNPVTFSLSSGSFIQLRGPNGAGKSTLLRHIAGLIPLGKGQIIINDAPCKSAQIAHELTISYLGHADGLHGDLSGYENYELLTGDSRQSLIQLALYDRPVSTYSAGQRQKLSLHMLQDDDDLWLLDEPSASLDEANLRYLEERIAGFLALGGSIIAATHNPLAQSVLSQTITLERDPANEVPSW